MLLVYLRNSALKRAPTAGKAMSSSRGARSTNYKSFSSSSSNSGSIQQITSLYSLQQKISSPKLSIVDFYATWCGPCKAVAPLLEQFAAKYQNVQFLKVDVDESPDIAQEYNVSAMPTFVLFKNSNSVGKIVGANIQAIKNALDAHN